MILAIDTTSFIPNGILSCPDIDEFESLGELSAILPQVGRSEDSVTNLQGLEEEIELSYDKFT